MICPFCGHPDDRVVDSREVRAGAEIRRRRECSGCGRRFTTYERVDELPATVVKRDGRRELFDREKLLGGLLKACEKRPVPQRELMAIVDAVESTIAAREVREMTSSEIGNTVIEQLRRLDQVAYVRFASVYRRFEDVHQFLEELRQLVRPTGANAAAPPEAKPETPGPPKPAKVARGQPRLLFETPEEGSPEKDPKAED
jgi:transcriptional repressor NrdR